MQIQLKDIQPNPFRRIDHYPINREKVEALKESIETTGFWDNVVARKSGGRVELAYGHHRLVALKEVYGPRHEVNLIIRDLDDEQMLKIMARENMQEWGHLALVEQETIKAIIEAFAARKIELENVNSELEAGGLCRVAPSFISSVIPRSGPGPNQRLYTSVSLTKFLGWKLEKNGNAPTKLTDTLRALSLIEQGILSHKDFSGLTSYQARLVVEQAGKAQEKREREAQEHRHAAEVAERQVLAANKHAEKAKQDKNAAKLHEAEIQRKEAEVVAKDAREKEKEAKKEGARKAREVGMAVGARLKDATNARTAAIKAAYEVDGKAIHDQAAKAANAAAKHWETKALQLKDHAVKDYINAIREFLSAQKEALKNAKAGRFAVESFQFFKSRHQLVGDAARQIEIAIKEAGR